MRGISSWCQIHGPMRELISDDERGIVESQETVEYCKGLGIQLKPRAVGQQIPIVDRRGQALRDQLHRITSQCEQDDIYSPLEHRLSEATFAGNALTSINGSTPYNAVYGRSPALLPELQVLNEDGEISPITDRTLNRVREIAIQTMVNGTAHARILTALRTKSLPSGESQQLTVGDAVEYYRKNSNKEISGWTGDALSCKKN